MEKILHGIAANMLDGDESVYALYDADDNPVFIDAIFARDGHPIAIHFYFEASDDAEVNTIEEQTIEGVVTAIKEFIHFAEI